MLGKGSVRAGFTVVELLIAVGIAGIVSAIAIPNCLRYIEKSKETTAISDINAIAFKLKAIMVEDPSALPADLSAFQSVLALSLLDPWGNPYRYVRFYGHPENLNAMR